MTSGKPLIGAHVSAAVELPLSLERAKHIGAETTQIFISPPQQWLQTMISEEEIAQYKTKWEETDISPNFIHATYLINLATQNPEHLKRSIDWLRYGLRMADQMGVKGVIVHPGSHKGRGFETVVTQMVEAIITVLNDSPSGPYLILENCAGSGGVIGSFEELGELLKRVNNKNLKVCLDTQHAFACGYDLSKPEGINRMMEELEEKIGLDNLAAVHANDSKVEVGSNRDRHENIGEGFIGKEGFRYLINHPKLKGLPFILEVPGFAGTGPDKDNIDILCSLINN